MMATKISIAILAVLLGSLCSSVRAQDPFFSNITVLSLSVNFDPAACQVMQNILASFFPIGTTPPPSTCAITPGKQRD